MKHLILIATYSDGTNKAYFIYDTYEEARVIAVQLLHFHDLDNVIIADRVALLDKDEMWW